ESSSRARSLVEPIASCTSTAWPIRRAGRAAAAKGVSGRSMASTIARGPPRPPVRVRYTRRPMSQTPAASPSDATARRERVFSGIQPAGASHLGNYLGEQQNYVALQDRYEAIYAIVDLHALTTVHDGAELQRLGHEMVLDLLAVGLDPDRCALVRQSD